MDHDLSAGGRLSGVLIGPPLGGYVALWEENDVSFWRLPGRPPSMLGAGAMIRVEDETGRYRELGMLDRDSGLLVLNDRAPGPGGTPVSQLVPLTSVSMAEAKAASVREDSTGEPWLGEAAAAAAARGEWLAIHRGSWAGPFVPVVVSEVLRDDNGAWQSVVRATPVPVGAGWWSDHPVSPGAENQQLTAPASHEALRLAGAMAIMAFLAWDIHPLMLGLTCGPNPLGPWSESAG